MNHPVLHTDIGVCRGETKKKTSLQFYFKKSPQSTATNPIKAAAAPNNPPNTLNDEAAPSNGAVVDDGRGPLPVPLAWPVPAGAGAVPDAAGAPAEDEGMGNGGATETEAGTLETATEAVVSVAEGSGALVGPAVLKSAGRVTPLSIAQVFGSMPLGQQKPLIKQKDPDGQGSGEGKMG